MRKKLVVHMRDVNQRIQATLVAISPEEIGIAIRNPNDQCNKRRGVHIAESRAVLGVIPKIPTRFYSVGEKEQQYLESALVDEYLALQDRAKKYFKPQQSLLQ